MGRPASLRTADAPFIANPRLLGLSAPSLDCMRDILSVAGWQWLVVTPSEKWCISQFVVQSLSLALKFLGD